MGKKNNLNVQVPNTNSIANRDIIQRLNFLYQASVYLNGIPPPSDAVVTSDSLNANGAKKNRRRKLTTSDLSKSYIKTMKIVGQKTTVKMYEFFSGPLDEKND